MMRTISTVWLVPRFEDRHWIIETRGLPLSAIHDATEDQAMRRAQTQVKEHHGFQADVPVDAAALEAARRQQAWTRLGILDADQAIGSPDLRPRSPGHHRPARGLDQHVDATSLASGPNLG
jgi:hypothetical protein